MSEVSERLGLPNSARKSLSESLDAMASRGLLQPQEGSRYRVPKKGGGSAEVQGRFSQNPRGFGFVNADDGGPDAYIPATAIAGAMHGDRVAMTAHRGPNGREGVIVRVVTRRPPRVPGVLRTKARGAWVEPDDMRIRGPIPVEEVGNAKDGDAVVCEIVRWPEMAGELPLGLVRESLGRPGQLDVEVMKVLLREGVEEDFPPAAVKEAKAYPPKLQPADYKGREDLRQLPLSTIDPEDARDHDDAVHVRRRDDGGFVATIAIADVSHYVRPGTALDEAALERGTSIYLPERSIPMLPRELSSHLASLIENEDRLALVVEVQLDADGKIEKSRMLEAVMRSHASLTYANVAWVMGWSDLGKPSDAAVKLKKDIESAAALSAKLRERRMRRGSLDFDLPEARVKFAPDGITPIDIVQSRQDPGMKRAYNLIEELMLLANEVIAATCEKREVPTVYRVHGAPEESGLLKLSTVARAYGFDLDPEDAAHPKRLAKFVRKIAETPAARVLGMVLLRSMPQAQYHIENRGHFGLAAPAYLHFTSPIRRYPDIIAHRVVRAILRKERIRTDDEAIEKLRVAALESSRLERRAMEVDRESMDLHRCVVAQSHIGEVHTGIVSGLSARGPFVQLDSPFIDVMLPVQQLSGGDWRLDDLGIRLTNERTGMRFALGDEVTLQITEVSIPRRTVYGTLPGEVLEKMGGKRPTSGSGGGARGDRRGRREHEKQPAGKKTGTHAKKSKKQGGRRR